MAFFKELEMKISKIILSLGLIAVCSATFAEDFISANGVKVSVGKSQRFLESKFGVPDEETEHFVLWELDNGNRLTADFDEYGLSDASVSGEVTTDYLSTDGVKVYLNKESINDIKKKITQGCYHEGWGNGKIAEYVVISGPEGSYNLIFTTYGGDEETDQLKKQKISSIKLGYKEPFGERESCD